METTDDEPFRREMTWSVLDEKANRFANLLLSRGVRKDDKVAILLYNCIEWLPLYFGVLKSGATVVPLNFRYSPTRSSTAWTRPTWTSWCLARSSSAAWRR